MNITLIGLGKMGSVLAQRLLAAKYNLTVFNRTPEKMQPLINAGAKGANSLEDAVKDATIIITCLLDDHAVLETVNHFVHLMQPKAIHVGTSTILPETSKKLAELHQKHNSTYIAANVLGVPKAAARGELTTLVAGQEDAIAQCKPIFSAYSIKIIHAGSQPFQANVIKICMNYFLVTAIEAMGELYAFAEKSQVDISILNTLFHSIFAHPAFQLYVDKIKERDFDDVNFDMKGGFKDLNLFQQAFAQAGVVPDIANIIKDKFIIALAHHMENKDWSAVTEITRLESNLD
ncbi:MULTISPECIES: NAD(P)-dependent oxidoreductase [Legionella]|uniref:3-hydroxyisobutyrate dehydrogenase n=1 Tax=Legionella steelei TaxID=947033 RepID=A0A0W0ZHG8_9GAMM|nr:MULTISPECIES: NAD(P)-dependent oxidoreductase [Legionella]KTD68278.1 3-hydroxyisobutyrate dehydrogenase [Legionella steelei]MBN9226378.1 NAD(P)-dependent oxidoreductase [Legionella steelei]OJW12116.1 MAG: oxidoreductase [Legionella sp. 39-23]